MKNSNIGIAPSNILQEKFRQAELSRHRGEVSKQEFRILQGNIVAQKQLVINSIPIVGVRVIFDGLPSDIRISSFDRWYGLAYPADFIAQTFGDNLVGRRCELRYLASHPEYGFIYIISNNNFESDMKQAIDLPTFSTVFAPAGKS